MYSNVVTAIDKILRSYYVSTARPPIFTATEVTELDADEGIGWGGLGKRVFKLPSRDMDNYNTFYTSLPKRQAHPLLILLSFRAGGAHI